ncbi:MAG: hypothetical protein K6T99_02995 [Armatimonadetes bacterium]|nr:hypothetical protein [Armatimonadota bacterium]
MNSRERVIRAIEFKGPDRVPLLHAVLPAAIIVHGQPLLELLDEFKDDFGGSWGIPQIENLPAGYRRGINTDEWGVVWQNDRDGMLGIPVGHPLADWSNFNNYRFPPNPDDDWFRSFQESLRESHDHYAMLGGINLFERMQWLRGYENLMYDLAIGSEEAYKLRDRLVEHHLEYLRKAAMTDVDGFHFGDDWGTQISLIISPDLWRKFYKPAYARMFEPCKTAGKHVHFHSDGMTWEILHDLVEIGVDVLNVQHCVMDLKALAREFGGKVAFRSDLDRQHVLPHGTRDEIRAHVREVFEALGSYNGGLIGHGEIAPDVPLENVRAMFEAWREFGVYDS